MKCPTLLLSMLACIPAIADEVEIYESIDDIWIGRVFLTPRQRRSLDVERSQPQPSVLQSDASNTANAVSQPSTSPAGYIISSRGTQRRWTGEEFTTTSRDSLASMSFPGDVRIIRHRSNDNDEIDNDKRDAEDEDNSNVVNRHDSTQ